MYMTMLNKQLVMKA